MSEVGVLSFLRSQWCWRLAENEGRRRQPHLLPPQSQKEAELGCCGRLRAVELILRPYCGQYGGFFSPKTWKGRPGKKVLEEASLRADTLSYCWPSSRPSAVISIPTEQWPWGGVPWGRPRFLFLTLWQKVDSHAPQKSQHSTSISGSCNEREQTGIWRGNPADTMLDCGDCSHTTDLLWSYSNSVVQVVPCGFNGKRPFSLRVVFVGNRGNKKQGCS